MAPDALLKNHTSIAATHGRDDVSCRFCGELLTETFVDLGTSPLCQSFVSRENFNRAEPNYPLLAHVCTRCFLVQLQEYVSGEDIFSEYAYFSSYSNTWLDHCRKYCETICERLHLGPHSQVVELASNDGYLLQYFVKRGVPALGIEPAGNVAEVAIGRGVPTIVKFFGTKTAHELVDDGLQADLLIGNNVLAHVPNLNDFVAGMKIVLGPRGAITMEFPHLMRLIEGNQFDTIYHEHFCYYSLLTVMQIFARHGMKVFDVEELPTHGGSLRIYVRHIDDDTKPPRSTVEELLDREIEAGYDRLDVYREFGQRVVETKRKTLEFLIDARRAGKRIAGYGAPGKGNTLLNYCGIRTDFIDYTVDRNPFKHGLFTPGTRIPIFSPEKIDETKPDYVFILPWNLKDEIINQLAHAREWGCKFVIPIPELTVFD